MKVLGICSDVWLSSAALIEDGKIIAACPEERLNRIKKFRGFPRKSIEYCLKQAGCTLEDIDYIAVGWNPGYHIKRYNSRASGTIRWRSELMYSIANSFMPLAKEDRIKTIREELEFMNGGKCRIEFVDHHLAHAANAFFLSPFSEAAIYTSDGRGEDETTRYSVGKGNSITEIDSVQFPHSLGLFYGTFTQFLGFTPDSDEWKVMALASYADKNDET